MEIPDEVSERWSAVTKKRMKRSLQLFQNNILSSHSWRLRSLREVFVFSRLPSSSSVSTASTTAIPSSHVTFSSSRESNGVSYGLNWALAGRGIIVKEKVFYNLNSFELQQKGARKLEGLFPFPIYMRGNVLGGTLAISYAQFNKLLKLVTSHISSVSTIFVQDGAVGSSSICNAKVRIISDGASAVLSISPLLWDVPTRAISHDSCPLTVYVATSIGSSTGDVIGIKAHSTNGFIAADVDRSSLILCGKSFADVNSVKSVISALAAPVVSARGGIPVSGRLLVSGESVVLVFASEDTFKRCSKLRKDFFSMDTGVILWNYGCVPFFSCGKSASLGLMRKPDSVIFASSDSSGVLPPSSRISPGQAAYHFLAGYQDGKFVSTYCIGPSPIPALELASSLLSYIKENDVPSFLVNVVDGGKHIEGEEFLKVIESTLSNNIPPYISLQTVHDPKVGHLKGKYNSFLLGKFRDLPEEFSF